MPRVFCTPEIIQNIFNAYKLTNARLENLFPTFEGKLNIQHASFAKYNVEAHSIWSQIISQFSFGMHQYEGLFFCDFDDTILDLRKMRRAAHSISDFDPFYNGAPRQTWINILQHLRRNKFFVVLCTSRPPVIGVELEPTIQKMVYQDLLGLFHAELFLGHLEHKGPVINCIREYISSRQKVSYPAQKVYLLDDDALNLSSAASFNISTIRSYPAPQHPLADFIIPLLPLPASPTTFAPVLFPHSPTMHSPTAHIPSPRHPF